MNARIVGNGEITLVLSHGFGTSQEIWEYVIPELSRRYKLLLFDWSFSSAADSQPAATDISYAGLANDLISLLDEMKMKGVVFIGHSLAGMVGCLASVDRPELFSHLVLVAASPRYMNSEEYQGGFEPSKIHDMLSSIEADFQSWADSFATLVLGKNYSNPLWKYLATLKTMNPKTALAVAKMAFLGDQRPLLEQVELPCTIIQCTNDIAMPTSVGHYMESKIKGKTTLEMVQVEGHFPHVTSPEIFIKIIDKILL
ncbi:hypothetical protein IEQ34_006608 [Dendrobium chrysotoxum]|uniref:AB hydrolase-1 domain-containing protein n=1 Tax=Dendrobium chrysotoxum TaxID=161865 RepID=A0AAV7H617_DENCH|nr:hypothetical protein IEQ34_006608 [Dendrobium chrysotoxum]